jgi:uncharacterized heparinase superfamily protein
MSRLTFAEQTRLAKLMVDRSCRSASARLKHSPLLKWRYGAPVAERILIVPQDLRAGDASFASEIEFGHFGLAGQLVHLDDRSPFDIAAPDATWARELHGFGWLRHLFAAGHVGARDTAIALVDDWGKRHPRPGHGVAWEPVVVGRRLVAWIVNAPIILDGVDQAVYDRTTDLLADQLIFLAASWRDAAPGQPRLEALTALLIGALCIAGHDRTLDAATAAFTSELEAQILPDGGHLNRNPATLVSLLLDFLPLRQCFVTRERRLPDGFDDTIRRMLKMLRHLRLGHAKLARFNGIGEHRIDALSTVLAYDDRPQEKLPEAPSSHYVRLERGAVVVLMDAGSPPPLEQSSAAHAGCLSFEMTARAQAVFVNRGAPADVQGEWLAAARATASHNTLCLGGRSSAKLVRNERLAGLIGGMPIRYPAGVEYALASRDGGVEVEAFHDGYIHRFKLLHRRHLALDAAGNRIAGIDRLTPQRGQLRLPQDIPFAIHFHLDATVDCQPAVAGGAALIILRDGQRWQFAAVGALLSIEESSDYAAITGPRPGLQIVLRAATFGESEVRWTMERVT